jgi:hypothetical protein
MKCSIILGWIESLISETACERIIALVVSSIVFLLWSSYKAISNYILELLCRWSAFWKSPRDSQFLPTSVTGPTNTTDIAAGEWMGSLDIMTCGGEGWAAYTLLAQQSHRCTSNAMSLRSYFGILMIFLSEQPIQQHEGMHSRNSIGYNNKGTR